MEYPLYMDGEAVGTLRVENDGLRLHFAAHCPCREGLWRAYALSGSNNLLLGVMVPEGRSMATQKSLSLSSLGSFDPESISQGIVTQGEASMGWVRARDPAALFADPVLKTASAALKELWFRPTEGGRLIAVPWQPGCPFPLASVFTLCRVQAINGRCFALLECDEKGWPRVENR